MPKPSIPLKITLLIGRNCLAAMSIDKRPNPRTSRLSLKFQFIISMSPLRNCNKRINIRKGSSRTIWSISKTCCSGKIPWPRVTLKNNLLSIPYILIGGQAAGSNNLALTISITKTLLKIKPHNPMSASQPCDNDSTRTPKKLNTIIRNFKKITFL